MIRHVCLLSLACLGLSSDVTHSSNLEIVLARCKEDLTWLDDLEYGSVTTVYDKCGVHDGPGRHVTQPNVGREGGTYLRHIVDNYDHLADWTVFSQAEQPTYGYRGHRLGGGHMMNSVRFEDYVQASRNKEAAPSFFVFSTALTQTDSVLYQCFRKGYGEEYEVPVNGISRCGALQQWQRWVQFPDWFAVSVSKLQQEQGAPWPDFNLEATLQLFEVAPSEKVLFFAQGARFAASREAIQSRSRDYYLKLLSYMEHADPWAGYFLEWMWFYVLTGEQAACGYEHSLAHAHVNLLAKGRVEITEAISGVSGADINVSLITNITADVTGRSITFLTGSSTTVSITITFESTTFLSMELSAFLSLLVSATFRAAIIYLTGVIELSFGVTHSFEGDVECTACKFGLSSGSVFAFGGSSVLLSDAEFYGVSTDTAQQTVTLAAGTAMKCAASTTTSVTTPLTFSGSGTLSHEASSTFDVSADVSLDVDTTMTSSKLKLGAGKKLSCKKPVKCAKCAMDLADGSAVALSGATATFSGATFNTSGDSTVEKSLTCAAGTAMSIEGTEPTTIATALSISGAGTLSCTGSLNVSADVSLDVETTMSSPSSLMLGAGKKLSCKKPVKCNSCAMDLADGSAVALSGATATFSGATFTTSGDSTVEKNLTCAAGTAMAITGAAATTVATALSISGAGTLSCEADSTLDLTADLSLDVDTTMTSSKLKLGAGKKLSCKKPVKCNSCAMDLADGSAVALSGATAAFSGATFSTSGTSTVAKAISCAAGTMLSFAGAATSTISTALSISGAGNLSCEAGSVVAVAEDVAIAVAAKMTSSTMSLGSGKMVTFSNTMECTSCSMALADGSSLMLSGPTVSLSGAQFTGASGSAAAKAVTCAAGTVVSFLAGTTNTLDTALSFAGAGSLSFEAGTTLSVGADVAVAVDSAFDTAAVNVAAGGALAFGAASVSVSGSAFALADATAALSFAGTNLTVGPAQGSAGTNITGSGTFSLSAGATLEILEPLTIRVSTDLDSVDITHNTANKWKFRGAPTKCKKCKVKGGGPVSFEGSSSVPTPTLALNDSSLEMDLDLQDSKATGSDKGSGSGTGSDKASSRRTDLTGFVTATYCGTTQTGALSLNSSTAVEFNLGCQVSGIPYSNTVTSLTYAAGSIVAVVGVTASSLPTLIESLSSPSGLPLEVVISSLGAGAQTVTLIEYGNPGSCPTSFSAVVDNCDSGATCSVVGQTVNSSFCAIVLEQVENTSESSSDNGLYGLLALIAIPVLLLLAGLAFFFFKSSAADPEFAYQPPPQDGTSAPYPTPAGSMATGYAPAGAGYAPGYAPANPYAFL